MLAQGRGGGRLLGHLPLRIASKADSLHSHQRFTGRIPVPGFFKHVWNLLYEYRLTSIEMRHFLLILFLFAHPSVMANDEPVIENHGPLKFSTFNRSSSKISFKGSIKLTGIYRAWGDVDQEERVRLEHSGGRLPTISKEAVFSAFIPDEESIKKLPWITQHSYSNPPNFVGLDEWKSGLEGWRSLVKTVGLAKANEFLNAAHPSFESPVIIVIRDLTSYEGCQGFRNYNAKLVNIMLMPTLQVNVPEVTNQGC